MINLHNKHLAHADRISFMYIDYTLLSSRRELMNALWEPQLPVYCQPFVQLIDLETLPNS